MGSHSASLLVTTQSEMKSLIVVVLASLLAFATAQLEPHAECSVVWTVSEECESVQTKIESQMFEWYSEENCGEIVDNSPNGQKCLYRHNCTEGMVTTGTHTTPIQRYIDDMTFTFTQEADYCSVDGYSRSRTTSVLDFGTNYCNLFNLMDGSGVPQGLLTEETNDDICVQYSTADCEVY